MRTAVASPPADDSVFSANEIARAAGVPVPRVLGLLRGGYVASRGPYVARNEAIRLVRVLGGVAQLSAAPRPPLTLVSETRRRQALPLFFSGALHIAFLLTLVVVTSGLLAANDTELEIKVPQPVRLVYIISRGPGGGGGGGGLKLPDLPTRAERKAPPKILPKVTQSGAPAARDASPASAGASEAGRATEDRSPKNRSAKTPAADGAGPRRPSPGRLLKHARCAQSGVCGGAQRRSRNRRRRRHGVRLRNGRGPRSRNWSRIRRRRGRRTVPPRKRDRAASIVARSQTAVHGRGQEARP